MRHCQSLLFPSLLSSFPLLSELLLDTLLVIMTSQYLHPSSLDSSSKPICHEHSSGSSGVDDASAVGNPGTSNDRPVSTTTSSNLSSPTTVQRRNSLQLLGSIAHLQHLYNQQGSGCNAKVREDSSSTLPTTTSPPLHSKGFDLLEKEAHAMWLKCCQSWSLFEMFQADIDMQDHLENTQSTGQASNVNFCHLLTTTRRTLQCVRDYLLAIPAGLLEDDVEHQHSIRRITSKSTFRRQSSYYCSPRQEVGYGEGTSSSGEGQISNKYMSKHRSESNLRKGEGSSYKQHKEADQPLPSVTNTTALIRRAALEVLLQLKHLEQEAGNEQDLSLDVSLSDLTLTSMEESGITFFMQDKNVSLDCLTKEKASVWHYLKLVRSTFDRISRKKALDLQTNQLCLKSVQIAPIRLTYSAEEGLAGALDILCYLVSKDVEATPPNGNWTRRSALEALSDGYLLCQAFNGAVKASAKPWGFIDNCDIYNLKGSSNKIASSWTFRKRHNLIVWAAALKARYTVSIPSFDTLLIAKAGPTEDWMDMLQDAICLWAQAVVNEAQCLK